MQGCPMIASQLIMALSSGEAFLLPFLPSLPPFLLYFEVMHVAKGFKKREMEGKRGGGREGKGGLREEGEREEGKKTGDQGSQICKACFPLPSLFAAMPAGGH